MKHEKNIKVHPKRIATSMEEPIVHLMKKYDEVAKKVNK